MGVKNSVWRRILLLSFILPVLGFIFAIKCDNKEDKNKIVKFVSAGFIAWIIVLIVVDLFCDIGFITQLISAKQ